jgi:hypothetical protein
LKKYQNHNIDRLGILTAITCSIHCTVLPAFLSGLPLLGVDLLENKFVEWTLIILAFCFGFKSLVHGCKHHHGNRRPLYLFCIGFSLLILNQILEERFLFILIPLSALGIISSHLLNIMYYKKK